MIHQIEYTFADQTKAMVTGRYIPDVDKLTADSPAPVEADSEGRYPAPVPGKWVEI